MPVFKSTIIFDIREHGWSETYWQNLGDSNFGRAISNLKDLARARALVLGNEASVKAVKVSLEGVSHDGLLNYFYQPGAANFPCADQDLGVLITMKDLTLSRTKNVWLKGFWDDVESAAGTYIKNLAGWQKALSPYLQFFNGLNNTTWGWWGVDYAGQTKANLSGYTQLANNIVSFVFATPIFPLALQGQTVSVRLSGVNGKSKLNGNQTVVVDSTTVCHSYQPLAVVPYSFGGRGTYSPKAFVLANLALDQKISERKTGAPLLEERGRAKARPRV